MVAYKNVRFIPWLGWLAVLFLSIGGALFYFLYSFTGDPATRQLLALLLALSFLAAGIFLICATADFWIKR